MEKHSKQGWITLAVILVGLAVLLATFAPHTPEDTSKDTGVNPKTATESPQNSTAPDPAGRSELDDDAARALFAERVSITPASDSVPLSGYDGLGYGRMEITFPGGPKLLALFGDIRPTSDEALVLTLGVNQGDTAQFDALPLTIMAPDARSGGAEAAFSASYSQTPYFRLIGNEPIEFTLNAAWIPAHEPMAVNRLAAGAGDVAEALQVAPSRWPPRAAAAVRADSAAFGQLLDAMQTRKIRRLMTVRLGVDGGETPAGVDLLFKEAGGKPFSRAQVRLTAQRTLFGNAVLAKLDYPAVMNVRIGAAGTLGDHFATVSDVLAEFMGRRDETEVLAACRALRSELQGNLGLHDLDAALVIVTAARPRAVFAGPPKGLEACIGQRGMDLLQAAGVVLPKTPDTDLSTMIMNHKLNRLAAVLKSDDPDRAAPQVVDAFAAQVVLEDRTGFWLPEDGDLTAVTRRGAIHPAADPQEAARRLGEIPAESFGCYHKGEAGLGRSRATLLALAGDDGIWSLEAAFDAEGKVRGLQFRAASQEEFCRATGSLGDSPNTCAFARETRSRRGIDRSRCAN